MAKFQFIGDVSVIRDQQKEFIARVVQEHGFDNVDINLQQVGNVGDNYAACVKRIVVEKDGKSFKMIAKIAPDSEIMRTGGNSGIIFGNEHAMYTQVLPKFTELEKAANIPKEERLKYAVCYGAYMESPNEIILLEDLAISGFQILDKFVSLTDENVRLVLKTFATYNSLSFALKYQEPETFEAFCNTVVNGFVAMAEIPETAAWLNNIETEVQLLLTGGNHKKAVKNTISKMVSNLLKLAKVDASSKHSIIQQGDAWTNNIMFRLENDRTVECCMIDYQMPRQSSPVADILYMIFSSTDYATRKNHYHDWIDYYHFQLDKSLANFGLKANYVYPRDQLDADLRRYGKFALGQAVMLASVLCREATDAAKLKDAMHSADSNALESFVEQASLASTGPETKRKFKERVAGVVDSFIEYGYV